MSVQSWLDQDVGEVADLLAKEAVARRLVKEADLPTTLRDFGTKATDYASDAGKRLGEFGANFGDKAQEYGNQALTWLNEPGHQGLRHGLAGAGLGGLLGLGSQFARDPEDRQYGSSALSGALAGGAIGGGLGMMRQFGGDLYGPKDQPQPGGQPGGQSGGTADLDSKIEELNQQIAQHEQSQAAQRSTDFGNAARQGGMLAGGVLGTDQFLQNRPSQSLRRGALAVINGAQGAAPLSSYNDTAKQTINALASGSPTKPNAGLASAYFDFRLPGRREPVSIDPLDIVGRTQSHFDGPPSRVNWRPKILANADDLNPHLPGLTNKQVRSLNSLRGPSTFGRYGALGLGLLPLALNYLANQSIQQQQQAFAQSLSGGSN